MPADKWDQYAVQQPQNNGGADKWAQYAQPASAPPDTRNDLQKTFDTNTATSPSDSLLQTGLKSLTGAVGAPFVHPIQTAKSFAKAITPDEGGAGIAESALGPVGPMLTHMIGGTGKQAVSDYKEGGLPYAATKTAGNIAGQALLGELGGAAFKGARGAVKSIRNFRPESSPSIVPPIQTAAENLAGSIVPKANDIPGFVENVTKNAGNINDFVKRSGNPLRTQAEFEKAVKGAGDERYQHFMKDILGPNADTPVPVPDGYGGTRAGVGTAKLGDINSRIGRLNNLTNPAYGFANPGDVATSLAKTPMEVLQAEHGALVPLLHDSLSEATGIPSEQIGSLRQSFGSLKSLGDLITEARAGRTGKVGLANESTGGSSIPRPSLLPFADQAVDAIRGGRNAIADRSFQKAWGQLKPLIGDAEPLPQSPEGFQEQRAYQTAANQEAARMEATRAHESTNAAQDAANQRGSRASNLRESKRATADAERKLEGEAARTIGRDRARSGGR